MLAVKGIIRGNTVVFDNEELRDYDGAEVIVTMIDEHASKKTHKKPVDWDSFVMPSERGKDVDAYMREMRDNDRI